MKHEPRLLPSSGDWPHERAERPERSRAIAHKAMTDRGLEPDFPPDALQQLNGIQGPARETDRAIRDLRAFLWCSIDNDTSRDLDQLTVAEKLAAGGVKVLVAIADVDAIVKPVSPIDRHARTNTTSVYTAAEIFPMLPERLSTDLTSLGESEDRLALVIEMVVAADGSIQESAGVPSPGQQPRQARVPQRRGVVGRQGQDARKDRQDQGAGRTAADARSDRPGHEIGALPARRPGP